MLRMFEHAGKVKKAISVLKKRSGRHEESIRQLWFDSDGIHLSEPLMHLRGCSPACRSRSAAPASAQRCCPCAERRCPLNATASTTNGC